MPKTCLIDGDMLAFRVAAATEKVTEWDDDLTTVHGSLNDAKPTLINVIESIRSTSECDDVLIVLSDDLNWRKTLDPSYKANRKQRRPCHLPRIIAWLREEFPTETQEGLEADDVLGIRQTDDTVICSGDKDLRMVAGKHLNLISVFEGVGSVFTVTPEQGFRLWLGQTLTGDSTDNYPGCPSIGPKRAATILDKEASWASVVTTFAKKDLTEDDAAHQAALAFIFNNGFDIPHIVRDKINAAVTTTIQGAPNAASV